MVKGFEGFSKFLMGLEGLQVKLKFLLFCPVINSISILSQSPLLDMAAGTGQL